MNLKEPFLIFTNWAAEIYVWHEIFKIDILKSDKSVKYLKAVQTREAKKIQWLNFSDLKITYDDKQCDLLRFLFGPPLRSSIKAKEMRIIYNFVCFIFTCQI